MIPEESQLRTDATVQIAYLTAELAEERETLDAVNRIGTLLSAELNLDKLVQAATDAATELTGAEFGSFFYNVVDENGESYVLYTISGVPREMFANFPMPRNTPVFGPTFRGEGIIRLDDVTKDARYGQMDIYHGMPPGHLPVRSYLALPVVSRSGQVLGGLFFGHSQTGVFTERAGRNVQALVAQLAAAMDNARLFGEALRATEEARSATERALQEIEERRRVEDALVQETRHAAMRADVSAALAQGGPLREVLQRCAEPVVRHLDGAFARIWTVDAEESVLVLQASAGMYTQVDGPQARIPIGDKAIGQIAAEKMPYLTNDVLADARLSEEEWAGREKMVAFAGYPLLIEDRVVGVVALFARHELPLSTLEEIATVADMLAQGVERKRVEQRLAESELRQRTLVKEVLASVTDGRLRLCNTAAELPARLPPVGGEPVSLSKYTLRTLRDRAANAAHVAGLPHERELDLLTATNEAAMNAVVHAGSGTATVGADADAGAVQIWVEDRGGGIDVRSLPRATLDRGYTTAGTLGHGFKMVLSTIDAVWLLTGPEGTTVVLSQGREEPAPGWLARA